MFSKNSHQKYQDDLVIAVMGQNKDNGFTSTLTNNLYLSAELALEVYQKDYKARMTAALGETYPSVWGILGDLEFFELCSQYIFSHPSHSYSLQHYGDKFSEFLWPSLWAKEFPFIHLLAQLDWAFHEIFHLKEVKNHKKFEPAMLEHFLDQPLQFSPTQFVLVSNFPLEQLWRAAKQNDISLIPDWKNQRDGNCLFLYKQEKKIYTKSFSSEVGELFLQLQKLPLGVVLEDSWPSDVVQELFTFLGQTQLILTPNINLNINPN